MEKGIELDKKTVSEMADLCEYLGMNAEEYLGKEAASIPRQESSYNI